MRVLFAFIFGLVLSVPLSAWAIPVSIDRLNNDHLEPLIRTDYIKAPYFTGSSTTFTSVIPRLSSTHGTTTYSTSTNIAVTTICLTGDTCRTTWPSGSGGGLSTTTSWLLGELAYVTSSSSVGSTATGTLTEGVTGLEFTATRYLVGGSAVLNLTSGYQMLTTASGTAYDTFYNAPSSRITAGTGVDWSGNTINGVYTAGDGITLNTEDFDCDTASGSVFGCLAAADWTTFNNKQATVSAGNLITIVGTTIGSIALATTSIDTIAELESILGSTNVIVSGEIDSLAEIETLTSVSNILIENDIDASSELAALMDDETGSAGNLVFSTSPTITGTLTFTNASGVLTTTTAATTSNMYISAALRGAGLTDCDTAATSKLLWDATAGQFSCGTDQNSGGGGSGGGWATTTDNNPEVGEVVTYTAEDVLIGGTASNTAEFNFDVESASFILSSTSAASAFLGIGTTSEIAMLNVHGGGHFATMLGIATTTPSATLSIHAGAQATPFFAIGSSTASLFTINAFGGITQAASQPATSTAITLDWDTSPQLVEYRIGGAATTITIINATTTANWGSRKVVTVCNPNGTAGALTWAGPRWIGTAPTQTTTANKCDVYSFIITKATSSSAYTLAGTAGTGL